MHSKIPDDISLDNILRLKFKKPKNWRWELTTSKSSPNINIPIIQLVDHKGELLAEATDPNGCVRHSWHSAPSTVAKPKLKQSSSLKLDSSETPQNKYKLCTSKAGTLVIRSDSTANYPRRRSDLNINKFGNFYERPESPNYRIFTKKPSRNWDKYAEYSEKLNEIPSGNIETKDFSKSDEVLSCSIKVSGRTHSKSDQNLSRGTGLKFRDLEPEDCDYTVQEPMTPLCADPKSKPQFSFRKLRPKKNSMRKLSSESTTSCESVVDMGQRKQRRRRKKKGDRVLEIDKTPVTNLDTATKSLRSASDAVLLRLVRRLRSSIHSHESKEDLSIKSNLNIMGANVSRHSGKGLSGRRTQSSGNICNGKPSNVSRLLGPCATTDSAITPTTNNKYRFCGSLPNNLDDEVLANVDAEPINNNLKGQIVKVNTANNQTHVPKKQPAPPIPTLRNINRPNVELRLQNLHVKVNNDTALCDQGYGSERSPEDEYPPGGLGFPQQGCAHQCEENVDLDLYSKYPFIKPECTFTVAITKNSRGLGLSVTGGVDCGGAWPGLIRVKRLFPNQPAASCGLLSAGDLILAANGITLTGLTNYEALEVLRTTPTTVTLTVCRLPTEILGVVSPLSDIPPPPPKRDPPCSLNLLPLITPYEDCYTGEFDIILTKVQGSLGFTLRKEDESALGHYVRALVREPALSDGRIKPGDKIIAVNDVELSPFSHEEAVQFLRQCGQEVKLRLYRDAAQTPVAALSPTESEAPVKLKPLRQEAMDMLSDLAVRKLSPVNNGGNDEYWGRSKEEWSNGGMANGTVNRKLRRMQRTTPDSECDNSYTEGSYKYVSSQVTNSESDSFSRKASIGSDDNNTNLSSNDSDPNNCNERPIRPNFLNLGSPIQTPSSRKPKFQFSLAHNAYELNNLDADVLDAPNLTYKDDVDEVDGGMDYIGNSSEEPVSMPPIPSSAFMHAKPSYQSAHPKCGTTDPVDTPKCGVDGSKGLLKWKGIVFTPEGEADDPEKVKPSILHMDGNNFEIITIEMNRGWNSRLGFSLQQGEHGETYVSAVHSDSVASRDGRLKQGDLLLRVNDENVENMTTNNVIDMLRIVRGPVCIVIARKIL